MFSSALTCMHFLVFHCDFVDCLESNIGIPQSRELSRSSMGPVPWDVFQNSPGTKLLHSRSSVKDRELYIGLWWTHSSIMEVQLFCSPEKTLPLFLFNVPLNSPGWPLYGFALCLLEKEMATHSSTFAWKIPWTEEPGRLQSMGSQRVGHN